MSARLLTEQGHSVVLHTRNDERAEQARLALPNRADVVVGDLGYLCGIEAVAAYASTAMRFRGGHS
jgi:NAD(P)-dependent dehydrogenase (short-subunit alcohol dehydrogenase family)